MKFVVVIVLSLLAIGCSSPLPGLGVKFDPSGTLIVTNNSGDELGYSGNLLGGAHSVDGDFHVSVRYENGDNASQCGVFDPFATAQRLKLAPGESVRFSTWPGQIGELYCFSPGQRGTFTIQYATQRAGNVKVVLLTSDPVEFVGSKKAQQEPNPFNPPPESAIVAPTKK